MSDKSQRRALIRRILQDHVVASQEQLAQLLSERGVFATQATLSRDLRDMSVTRERTPAGTRYRFNPRTRYMRALREVVGMEIMDVRHNGVMVVVRTLSGRAEGVAGFLDSWGRDDIIGTVAGDDTLFIAPSAPDACDGLVAAIRDLSVGLEGSTEDK